MISYHPVDNRDPGESWRSEDVEENYALCEYQTNIDIVEKHLGGKVLDAGCGYGRWVKYFRDKGYTVVGVDVSNDAATIAWGHGLEVYCGDIGGNPLFGFREFGSIICFGVLEHIKLGVKQPLNEFYYLLQNDGILAVSVPTQNILRYIIVNPLKTLYRYFRMMCGTKFQFEEYRYSRRQFRKLLSNSRFGIIEELPDELSSPKNIGLWIDFPFLRSEGSFNLNGVGVMVRKVLDSISPWISNGSTLWICRKDV